MVCLFLAIKTQIIANSKQFAIIFNFGEEWHFLLVIKELDKILKWLGVWLLKFPFRNC